MSHLKFVSQFKDSPDALKPREKLEKNGPYSLQLWELIALILRTGQRHKGGGQEDVKQLSKRLFSEAGFRGLFSQNNVEEIQSNFQLYKSHAQIIVAISEIVRRMNGKYETFDASMPEKIVEKFKFLQSSKQEQCHVLLIDKEKKCIHQEMIAMGGNNDITVTPSDILRSPIWLGIDQVIIIHNHLGITDPSKEDINWTLSLKKGAADFHKIQIVDHIIIGKKDYFSFLEKGLL